MSFPCDKRVYYVGTVVTHLRIPLLPVHEIVCLHYMACAGVDIWW